MVIIRLSIKFVTEPAQNVVLPIQYNHYIQSALYEALDANLAEFLHEEGYESSGRQFKLFTFSRLLARFSIKEGIITFTPPLELVVATPLETFAQSLMNGLLANGGFRLGDKFLRVGGGNVSKPRVESDILQARVLSPVVAYSTLLRPDGRKYTVYFQPGESEFNRLIAGNLRNKYSALYGKGAPEGEVSVKPLQQPKLHVMNFKGTVIKGYSAPLKLMGPRPLLQIALDAGLGSKNSMGFGCLNPLKSN